MNISKLVVVCTLLAASSRGQSSFTVSSVKPNQSGKGGGADLSASHGMLTIRDLPLDMIIAAAYGVAGYQISGPQWLRQERFDIVAKRVGSHHEWFRYRRSEFVGPGHHGRHPCLQYAHLPGYPSRQRLAGLRVGQRLRRCSAGPGSGAHPRMHLHRDQ